MVRRAIGLVNLDLIHESAASSQNACHFDEAGRQIDRRHPATIFGRKIARRAAEAASEIEDIHAGLDLCPLCMLACCNNASAMQLVEWPQIAVAGLLRINPSSTESIVDPLQYRPISVIALNHCLDVGHARLPIIVRSCLSRLRLGTALRQGA